MAVLDTVDASVLLDGPDRHLLQGPWPTSAHWQGLRERGDALGRAVCVVNMHWMHETPPPEHWRAGDQLLWMNAVDGPFPLLGRAWVDLVGRQVASAVAAGYVTYVHCLAGISRSTLATVSALTLLRGGTMVGNLEYVRSRRPVANPCPAFLEVFARMDKARREAV